MLSSHTERRILCRHRLDISMFSDLYVFSSGALPPIYAEQAIVLGFWVSHGTHLAYNSIRYKTIQVLEASFGYRAWSVGTLTPIIWNI